MVKERFERIFFYIFLTDSKLWLKGRYTLIVNCQRPVFSLGVSQHKYKITSLWSCEKLTREKTPLLDEFVFFQIGITDFILVRNYLLLKIYASSEVAVSHNALYYKQLSNARYQVSF